MKRPRGLRSGPVIFAALVLTTSAFAQRESHTTLELLTGDACNFDSDLRIHQAGQPDLDFTADWDTGGTGAMYYDLRFGWWHGGRAAEVEHLHHKIILTNNPPEVADFQISHGLNMFMYNQACRHGPWLQRCGAGLVITHAENTVRDLRLTDEGSGNILGGYRLSGVCAQYAIGHEWPIDEDWFATAEVKVTAAWLEVPVIEGEAELWNCALHALLGFGYRFD
ncbi:MAG: hypothetical protein AB7Y46_09185 [Armatimonadota bacterium]